MLASHYAPKKTMRIISDLKTVKALTPAGADIKRFSLLVLSGDGAVELAALKTFGLTPVAINCLTPKGDASEAARKLFSAMRSLDQSEGDFILTTTAPSSEGLWLAIMDRVTRASSP
jgi:hypothetical protein